MSKVRKSFSVGIQKGIRAMAEKLAEEYEMSPDELEKEITEKALAEAQAAEAGAGAAPEPTEEELMAAAAAAGGGQ